MKLSFKRHWMLFSVFVLAILIVFAHLTSTQKRSEKRIPAEPQFIERLKSAQHFRSTFPASRQTLDLARRGSLTNAALNAMGKELREVSGLVNGDPQNLFAGLSHMGNYGEVIWVDRW